MSRLLKHGRVWLIAALCLLATLHISAQSRQPWEEYLMQSGLIEDIENEDISERYDELCELAANPINLNHSTPEQLRQLPFITPEEYLRLVEYIDKVGEVHTWAELLVADITDKRRMRLLQYFAYLGEPASNKKAFSLDNILKYGKHEAMGYFKLPCYERRGDDHGYLGYPYRHWVRYTFNYGQDVKVGLVGAQDAGEPFFSQPNSMGYDYYSFYIQLQNRGWLRSLVVGRYRLRIGSGLVMNTNYSFGKLSALNGLGRQSTVISGHSSRSEANYLQGAAATIDLSSRIEATLFASHRLVDATLNSDSLTVATLLKSGYHRTQSEIDRRHNTAQTLWGANVAYHHGGLRLGLTGVYNSYNRLLRPDTTALYRRYAPTGDRFWNIGAEYSWLSPQWAFSGETATGDGGGIATINRLSFSPTQSLSLIAIQRFYSYRYHALMGRSFAEGTQVSNENGLYLSAIWHLARHWNLLAYTDYAYFTWPRYGVSFASHASDNLVQIEYRRRLLTWQTRYRLKLRQKDNATHTALDDYATHRAQTTLSIQSGRWTSKTQMGMAYSTKGESSMGWSAAEQIRYAGSWLQLSATLSYFDTDDYESRLYGYEYGLLYSFANPAFYGHGIRYALTARATLSRRVMIALKAATTDYFDRDHISSGLQQIDASSQTDIEMQLRIRL